MNHRLPSLGMLLVLLLTLVACNQTEPPPTTIKHSTPTVPPTVVPTLSTALPPAAYQVEIRQNVAYGPLADETLDLCLPQGATNPRPGVILVHGGGWVNGDKSEFAYQCSLLASEGFVAATVNYRLAPAHIWPAQLVDVQLAVRYLRANASDLQLDSNRLCSWGDSSGAHLAVFLGVLAQTHPGDEADLLADQSSGVSCVVDDFGMVNLITYGVTTDQKGLLYLLFNGATPESDPALYHDASPLFFVSAKTGPMLIIQGSQDQIVFPEQSRALQQALQSEKVPVQYLSYVGGHGFQGLDGNQIQDLTNESISFLLAYEHP
jgi:acetyl esterase/lipase